MIQAEVGEDVTLKQVPTDDNRSYHISSRKADEALGLVPQKTIRDAVRDLCSAFDQGLLPDSLHDDRYFNIKRMQSLNLN